MELKEIVTYMNKMVVTKRMMSPGGSNTGEKLRLNEFSEAFHNIESTKGKMLQADPT